MTAETAAATTEVVTTREWIEPDEEERERLYWLAGELVESLVEAHKLTMKILRFGYDEVYPKTLTDNRKRLEEEVGDVLGVVDMMCERGDLDTHALIEQRVKKVGKLKQFGRTSAGTGNPDNLPPELMRSDDRPGVTADSETVGAGRSEEGS